MTLQTQGLQTLEQLRVFLEGSQPLDFEVASREAAYEFITQTLRHFRYTRLGKADKGLLRRYLCKVTGCSRAQMIRRIAQFRTTGRIADRRTGPARPFPRCYTREDVLLAEIDALHATLSGPATRKLCERAYLNFHRPCFFPTEKIDARGRLRKHYRYENMMTPYEKLKSLPNAHHYLKPGITFKQLEADASAMSDNDAARHLNQTRVRLFRSIYKTQLPAA